MPASAVSDVLLLFKRPVHFHPQARRRCEELRALSNVLTKTGDAGRRVGGGGSRETQGELGKRSMTHVPLLLFQNYTIFTQISLHEVFLLIAPCAIEVELSLLLGVAALVKPARLQCVLQQSALHFWVFTRHLLARLLAHAGT